MMRALQLLLMSAWACLGAAPAGSFRQVQAPATGGGGGITPPTFIQEAETAWNVTGTTATTASFSVNQNDVLVAYAAHEGPGSSEAITVAGGSLTWTLQATTLNAASISESFIWTAIVDANKSMTVTFTKSGTTVNMGGNVLTFRGSAGVGNAMTNSAVEGTATAAITTAHANSAIVAVNSDWDATDGTTRTWATVNSITPTSGNGLETTYFRSAAAYTVYGAYWSDAGAAGSKTVGVSSPGGQDYSLCAVEIRGQ